MFRLTRVLLIVTLCATAAFAQGKGIDKSNERVRDSGASKAPASNGSKTDVGAGRGMDFGKGRTPEIPSLPNPYRMTARRDVILKAIEDVMRDQKLTVDEATSKPSEGIVASQPYTFIKGAVVSESELNRYGEMPVSDARGWTRGRYTLNVEVQPIDGTNSNVAVNAKVEGRTDGASGAEWVTLPSRGVAEEEFLAALVIAITGAPAPGRTLPNP
jgi:hypothetical protein